MRTASVVDADALARKGESQVAREFRDAWAAVQEKHAPLALLERAIAERRSNLLQHDLPWQAIVNDLYDAYKAALTRLFLRGAEAQWAENITKAVKPPAFNMKHPEAEAWARDYAAQLVQGLTNETRRAMSNLVAQMIRDGIPPQQGARMLRSMLGLTTPYSRAVYNFRQDLSAKGFAPDYIQSKADEYAQRLLNARARTVARTETMRAVQEGQRQSWTQAAEQGILRSDRTRKQWVTAADERVCPVCAPMDGVTTPLDEPWQTSEGPVSIPSETHPNCRCASVLVFVDSDGNFPTHPPRSTDTGQPHTPRSLRPKVRRA